MKLTINISNLFEAYFNNDNFEDFFERVKADLDAKSVVCGNYEKETIDMLESAFKNATIENMLSEADKEPLLDEVLNKGKTLVSRAYSDEESECYVRYEIVEYNDNLYYIEHEEDECTSFRKLK